MANRKIGIMLGFGAAAIFRARRRKNKWCPEEDSNLHALQR